MELRKWPELVPDVSRRLVRQGLLAAGKLLIGMNLGHATANALKLLPDLDQEPGKARENWEMRSRAGLQMPAGSREDERSGEKTQ
jgi:hypothetical protein